MTTCGYSISIGRSSVFSPSTFLTATYKTVFSFILTQAPVHSLCTTPCFSAHSPGPTYWRAKKDHQTIFPAVHFFQVSWILLRKLNVWATKTSFCLENGVRCPWQKHKGGAASVVKKCCGKLVRLHEQPNLGWFFFGLGWFQSIMLLQKFHCCLGCKNFQRGHVDISTLQIYLSNGECV